MLAIFNPEHDLCLANGDANYMPPASALRFAHNCAHVMKAVYGDGCVAVAADDVDDTVLRAIGCDTGSQHSPRVVAWGWDASLVRRLAKRGVPRELLPTDSEIATIRDLSHRRTAIMAAKACGFTCRSVECRSVDEVADAVAKAGRAVAKAPWSGSGRGLRWIDGRLSPLDRSWAEKTIATQGSLMVEPRLQVVQDFAIEYVVGNHPTPVGIERDKGNVTFLGFSLFATQNGVYRENRLLGDGEILRQLSQFVPTATVLSSKSHIESWLQSAIAPIYSGPLGIDMFVYRTTDGYAINPMVEINFRHTMGHVAVALRTHTNEKTFHPEPES